MPPAAAAALLAGISPDLLADLSPEDLMAMMEAMAGDGDDDELDDADGESSGNEEMGEVGSSSNVGDAAATAADDAPGGPDDGAGAGDRAGAHGDGDEHL